MTQIEDSERILELVFDPYLPAKPALRKRAGKLRALFITHARWDRLTFTRYPLPLLEKVAETEGERVTVILAGYGVTALELPPSALEPLLNLASNQLPRTAQATLKKALEPSRPEVYSIMRKRQILVNDAEFERIRELAREYGYKVPPSLDKRQNPEVLGEAILGLLERAYGRGAQ